MEIFIPILIIICILLVLLHKGRPSLILFKIEDLADTYEKFDFEGEKPEGRIRASFLEWENSPDHHSYPFLLWHKLQYNSSYNIFWKKIPMYLTLNVENCPKGFEIYIENQYGECFTEDNEFRVFSGKEASEINIVLNQIDTSAKLDIPELIKIQIKAVIDISKFFFNVRLEKLFNYNFFVGNPIGKVFISFDPGTTGSCVMSGTETGDIYCETDENKNELITHSIVSFKTDYAKRIDPDISLFKNTDLIECGNTAYQMIKSEKRHHFISIKKMLGYKNKPKITMLNRVVNGISNELEVSGIDLSSALINHLYEHHKESIGSF